MINDNYIKVDFNNLVFIKIILIWSEYLLLQISDIEINLKL